MKIGFIGSGNMAAAMARGWAGADGFDGELLFTDGGSGRAAEIAAEVGGTPRPTTAPLPRMPTSWCSRSSRRSSAR